ncbi:GreA/GreB family elongation factor [Flavobacteriaceae bacterium F89]|uniref:GreA/GreB family elongation factor n=1 Tax=Cerina litoralis TaxID=2874477 RepID=A0AAE3EZ77_9FLAO|nr:GreA/GreB family elongation factor [Cerina litoralis]MCG2462336.1 GreA/GreB family elongation factor [Cerina litoralis]
MLHFINAIISTKRTLKRSDIKNIKYPKRPKRIEGAKIVQTGSMKYGSLVMEKRDFVMILKEWYLHNTIEDYSHKDALDILEGNMADAIVFNPSDMPKDIIRLYSWVTVSSGSGWRETFQLVLPLDKDIKKDMISVHSSLGATVIGHAEGDLLHFGTPIGIIPLKIESVEQSGGYIKTDIPEDDYEKLLSERQRAFLSGINMEIRQN